MSLDARTGFGIIGTVGALIVGLVVGAGGNEVISDPSASTVPTTGVEGFNVEAFCDTATRVTRFPAPDAGYTVELYRNQDGVEETVTVIERDGEYLSGQHYYNTTVGQQSEPADVTGAEDCIDDKVK